MLLVTADMIVPSIKLPIDVVPGVRPLTFHWYQTTRSLGGKRELEHVGPLPPSVEDAVSDLIELAKKQAKEIAELKSKLAGSKSLVQSKGK